MENGRSDTLRRYEKKLDVTITAGHSVNDYLFPDGYFIRSSDLFCGEACTETPSESLEYAFSEPSETLFHFDRFQSSRRSLETHVDSDHISPMGVHDMNYAISPELESNDSSSLDMQTPLYNNTYERTSSPFVEWKPKNIGLLQPKKRQSLLKRCIRFLKDIDNHKIARPLVQAHQIGSTGCNRLGSHYDKLAIHHVVAERKRREQMNENFAALRALIPVSPKEGRATVLQHTKEYVIQLKRRVEELERRNRELEELLSAQAAHTGHSCHSL